MEKQVIRQAIRAERKNHPELTKKEKDASIRRKLQKLSAWKTAEVVLLYAPIPHEKEIDTWPLIKNLLKKGKMVALPVTNKKDKSITLKIITSEEDTELCDFKFPEPKKSCPTINPDEIDLAIIPGIAFDKQGNRLGFGHGYYDRLLKKLHCQSIALAYEFQILHAVPRHEHDVPIGTILTEKKTYKAL